MNANERLQQYDAAMRAGLMELKRDKLVAFCRDNDLPVTGPKAVLISGIMDLLDVRKISIALRDSELRVELYGRHS